MRSFSGQVRPIPGALVRIAEVPQRKSDPRRQLVFDLEDNLVHLSLDNKNGFNTLPRGLICSGLAEFTPELLHWFQYAYGDPSPLFCQGELVAHMATGCKQGDTTGGVSAFIDDTALFVDGRIADLVAHDTISIFTAAGISSRPPASLFSLSTTTGA